MIDINDLWIGDWLRLKKSGRIGKFSGQTAEGKLKIEVAGKIILTPITNVESSEAPPPTAPKLHSNRPSKSKQTATDLSSSIDLHMEVLRPNSTHTRPERILDIQVNAAKQFIEVSISRKTRKIEIIHGKGEGVLKSEIRHLLGMYDEVQFVFDSNKGGATEVWFDF